MQIQHLSPSQINTYTKCPMSWYFRYAKGLKIPPSGAMTLGSAFHTGTGVNYSQKIESFEDMPVSDVLEVYSEDFDIRAESTEWNSEDPGTTKDSGVQLLEKYQQVIAPETQPTQVEQGFSLDLRNQNIRFVGYIDLLDTNNWVIETKTTSKSLREPRHEHMLQGIAYAAAREAISGEPTPGVRFDYAIRKKEPDVLSFNAHPTEQDTDYFLTVLTEVAHAIESEVWIPNRAHFLCSRKWCGYWSQCEKTCGGRVKE